MRPEMDSRPYDRREDEDEKESPRPERNHSRHGRVSGDGGMGARFPEKRDGRDGAARGPHRESEEEKAFGGGEEKKCEKKPGEGGEEEYRGDDAFSAGGDPEIPHPLPPPHEKHVSRDEGRGEEFEKKVSESAKGSGLRESHAREEGGEDGERIQYVRRGSGEISGVRGHRGKIIHVEAKSENGIRAFTRGGGEPGTAMRREELANEVSAFPPGSERGFGTDGALLEFPPLPPTGAKPRRPSVFGLLQKPERNVHRPSLPPA